MRIKAELKKKFKYLSYEAVDEEISNTTDPKYLKKLLKLKAKIIKKDMLRIYPELRDII